MNHLEKGRLGEQLCADFLSRHGYKILKRNLNTRYAEVDIICERQGCLWAVEVKSRSSIDRNLIPGIVSLRQLRRIRNALVWYATDCIDTTFISLNLYLALVDLNNRKIQLYKPPVKEW